MTQKKGKGAVLPRVGEPQLHADIANATPVLASANEGERMAPDIPTLRGRAFKKRWQE
jgi:hypothetical protein